MEDLSKYSLSRLKKIKTEVEEELKKRHFLSVSQAREQILHIARGTGLSIDDLISGRYPKESKEPLAAKYRHPDDAEKKWSGRGRMPGWVKEWIASGRDLAETKV
jgi:DNA-binding protein H-NS